jgi:hypothetical protein
MEISKKMVKGDTKMLLKKPILFVLLLSILTSCFFSKSYANHQWNLLEGIEPNPSEFKEREIGEMIVYWKIRMLGKARVQKDKVIYKFDKESHDLLDVILRWRDDLPPVLPDLKITKEKAESMVEGRVQLSRLYILSPKSVVFSTVRPTPENPCWVVASADEAKGLITTVIDALEGKILGYGITPPYTAFSLSGPQEQNPCSGVWTIWYENAQEWFDVMGYSTETAEWPTEEEVQSHIQSKSTAMFYELAHGDSNCFASGCDNGSYEITWADEIEDWISGYTKMPFTFLGSCEGMCETGDGTLSYEFRKGSTEDTVTVGYCHMDVAPCLTECWWEDAFDWQDTLFECMSDGDTVKDAFDIADSNFPDCGNNECMRFAGDEDFRVVNPIATRVTPNNFIIKNSAGDPVAWFDYLGNLFLIKGTLIEETTPQATSIDEFRFQDSNGVDVAIIDANSGDMYIRGSLHEGEVTLNPQGDNHIIIKDVNDSTVAYIDDPNGDLYLKGKLYENP